MSHMVTNHPVEDRLFVFTSLSDGTAELGLSLLQLFSASEIQNGKLSCLQLCPPPYPHPHTFFKV